MRARPTLGVRAQRSPPNRREKDLTRPGADASVLAKTLDAETVRSMLPARRRDSRKGQNGRVLVVGGSHIYHGAPIIASLAALRAGSDLVYTAVPKYNVAATRAHSPNLIVIPMADQKLTRGAAKKLAGAVPLGVGAAAIGMGLVVAEKGALGALVSPLADSGVRLVLDAGALVPDVLALVAGKGCVLTPHAGEYARLFGSAPPAELEERAAEVEKRAAEHSVTVLLKGPTDVISDGSSTFLCRGGGPAMTVGGTGDALSGIAASIMARSGSALESAAAAAFINAAAGAGAQEKLGMHIMATDLIDGIPGAMAPLDSVG